MGVSKVEGGGPLVCVGVVAQSAFEGDLECHALVHHTHMANERVGVRVRQRALGADEADLRRVDGQDLQTLRNLLLCDTLTLFKSPLAEWQKLDAFRHFLFPRLSFALQVFLPGIVWCKRIDTSLRGIIKSGLRLPRRTFTSFLYLPQAFGGMGIPSWPA